MGNEYGEGTGKLKIGTNPNVNPSPISNFIYNSRNLFPLFIFPFPVFVPCFFFPVLVNRELNSVNEVHVNYGV